MQLYFTAGFTMFFLFAVFHLSSAKSQAGTIYQDTVNQPHFEWEAVEIPSILVLGERPRLMSGVPGSGGYVSPIELRHMQPLSANEALRCIPGVHVVDEEGIGLRPNIGIRGLDPDRSSRVLIMEDGIPVALNPYGEPQMYYSPAIERMQSIEVLKGSGQIMFGPQTIGGVINYVTADPPKQEVGRIKLTGGQGGYFTAQAAYGNTIENIGYRVDYLHKQADKLGMLNFRVHDFTGKLQVQLTPRLSLTGKAAFYDEISNATYVGLTQAMYDEVVYDFVRISPDDQLDVRRISASAALQYRFNLNTSIYTTAFAYSTMRNWARQDFSSSVPANPTGVIWGDTTVPGGALYMLASNGHRNRYFEVAGLDSRLRHRYHLGRMNSRLDAGVRLMVEKAEEQRINGTRPDARSGTLINDEMRGGYAVSAYIQNKWDLTQTFSITAGLRSETYFYHRSIYRTSQNDTLISSKAVISNFIPGFSFHYQTGPYVSLFGGIHRGFAPPRITQAIANSGEVYNLDPELSWNYELGIRLENIPGLSAELTLFHMDFENQIIPISESTGGSGSGLVNGGETRHFGVEVSLMADVLKWLTDKSNNALLLGGHVTSSTSHFSSDRWIDANDDKTLVKGNKLPYAPGLLVQTSATWVSEKGFSARYNVSYTAQQFTDELNTVDPASNGRSGVIPAFTTMDATLLYGFPNLPLTLHVGIKNITNERYIASRRPQGIRLGLPRTVTAGAEYVF